MSYRAKDDLDPTPEELVKIEADSRYWRAVGNRAIEILVGEGWEPTTRDRIWFSLELACDDEGRNDWAWWYSCAERLANIDAAARCQLAWKYRRRLAN